MKKYIFKTNATMKEYNRKNWWIDKDIIPEYRIVADSVVDALGKFAQLVDDNQCITISKNGIKNRQPMYIDTPNGVKQVGYVLTASTDLQDNNYHLVKQYIDLWVEILTICDTEFIEELTEV